MSADAEPPSSQPPGPDVRLRVQRACAADDLPDDAQLATWVRSALAAAPARQGSTRLRAAVTLRIVDTGEGTALNQRYRGKPGPTNVLSFPFEPPAGLPPEALDDLGAELGDLVICAPVLRREAAAQGKTLAAHTAHLVVHGTLHLLGYDHQDAVEATAMEALESTILSGLGFATPYEVPEEPHDERSSA
ncbi:rRNA maturation RNase YbeY [uncultured Thiohalocapsa sp.]|uniref:rRNA maturation RNase YbeY n=1 Tax=uncultured Thiohalocapsa sp. TaxID=768990 RepID=UPI0025D64B54|nr:rRNA maturation RNase YbeY [uncultured Thiohalocapsa sp.]